MCEQFHSNLLVKWWKIISIYLANLALICQKQMQPNLFIYIKACTTVDGFSCCRLNGFRFEKMISDWKIKILTFWKCTSFPLYSFWYSYLLRKTVFLGIWKPEYGRCLVCILLFRSNIWFACILNIAHMWNKDSYNHLILS